MDGSPLSVLPSKNTNNNAIPASPQNTGYAPNEYSDRLKNAQRLVLAQTSMNANGVSDTQRREESIRLFHQKMNEAKNRLPHSGNNGIALAGSAAQAIRVSPSNQIQNSNNNISSVQQKLRQASRQLLEKEGKNNNNNHPNNNNIEKQSNLMTKDDVNNHLLAFVSRKSGGKINSPNEELSTQNSDASRLNNYRNLQAKFSNNNIQNDNMGNQISSQAPQFLSNRASNVRNLVNNFDRGNVLSSFSNAPNNDVLNGNSSESNNKNNNSVLSKNNKQSSPSTLNINHKVTTSISNHSCVTSSSISSSNVNNHNNNNKSKQSSISSGHFQIATNNNLKLAQNLADKQQNIHVRSTSSPQNNKNGIPDNRGIRNLNSSITSSNSPNNQSLSPKNSLSNYGSLGRNDKNNYNNRGSQASTNISQSSAQSGQLINQNNNKMIRSIDNIVGTYQTQNNNRIASPNLNLQEFIQLQKSNQNNNNNNSLSKKLSHPINYTSSTSSDEMSTRRLNHVNRSASTGHFSPKIKNIVDINQDLENEHDQNQNLELHIKINNNDNSSQKERPLSPNQNLHNISFSLSPTSAMNRRRKSAAELLKTLSPNSRYYKLSNARARLDHDSPNQISRETNNLHTRQESDEQNHNPNDINVFLFPSQSDNDTNLNLTLRRQLENTKTLKKAANQYEKRSEEKLYAMQRLRRELEILTSLKKEILTEMDENNSYHEKCADVIKENGTHRDLEKFNLVVADLEPTMALIYSLTGRLKRCDQCIKQCEIAIDTRTSGVKSYSPNSSIDTENFYQNLTSEEQQSELSQLQQKYSDIEWQVKEAQEIKFKVELRRNSLMRRLKNCLDENSIKDVEYFINQKVHLFQQSLDMEDKLKLDEEQLKDMRSQMEDGIDHKVEVRT